MSEIKVIKREYPKYIAKNATPCPFCGGDSISVNHSELKYLGQNAMGIKKHKMKAYCVCNKCYARGIPVVYIGYSCGPYSYDENYLPVYSCGDEAIEAWNTRKPVDRVIELLESRADIVYEAQEMNPVYKTIRPIFERDYSGTEITIAEAIAIVKEGVGR